MRKTLAITGSSLVVILVICVVAVGLGYFNLGWTGFFGPKQAAVQNNVWQNSSPHVQSVEQDLARYQLELQNTTNPTSRAAIISYLQIECANVSPNAISNPELRNFMIEIQNGLIH